jgi:hypothetical protein
MRFAVEFARVGLHETPPGSCGDEAMGTVGNLELPARMSSCLRLFIETLVDDVGVEHGLSWHENREFQSALPGMTKTEEEVAHERFD